MKTIAFILLALPLFVNSQPGNFQIENNNFWRYQYDEPYREDGAFHTRFEYRTDGDTAIAGRVYWKVYLDSMKWLETTIIGGGVPGPFYGFNEYSGAIRSQGDSIQFVYPGESTEQLFYDFTLQVGDTVRSVRHNGKVVDSIQVLPGGRRRFWMEAPWMTYPVTVIEGIGSDEDFFIPRPRDMPGFFFGMIVCFRDSSGSVFQNPYAPSSSCESPLTFVDEKEAFGPTLSLSPNPSSGKFMVSNQGTKAVLLSFFDVRGKQVYEGRWSPGEKRETDFQEFDQGLYFFRGLDQEGRTCTGKVLIQY